VREVRETAEAVDAVDHRAAGRGGAVPVQPASPPELPRLEPVAGPVAEAAVAAVRRSSLAPLRDRVGATRLRLVWVLTVGAATVALLGVAPPREAGGLMVAAVAMLLVIRPVLLICLGDPTLFDPDSVDASPSAADDRR
jgi:hypothetical protein